MKKNIVRILLAVLTLFFGACVAPENALVKIRIGGGSSSAVHQQSGGYAQQPQVSPDGRYVKNTFLVGKETHGYHPQVQVRAKELDSATQVRLRDELDAWAIEQVKGGKQPPTDTELTAEAQRRSGTQDVQARAGNSFNNTTTAVPRELVSRQPVNGSTLTPTQRQEAQQRFYENLQHHTPPQ